MGLPREGLFGGIGGIGCTAEGARACSEMRSGKILWLLSGAPLGELGGLSGLPEASRAQSRPEGSAGGYH